MAKLLKRSIVVLVVLAVLGGLGYMVAHMLSGPAEGVIVNSEPYATDTSKSQIELEQFEGAAFTFAYPNSYSVRPATKDDPNSIETHTLIASSMMNKVLTVTVTKLPSSKLEDDPSYYMRSLHPDIYQMKAQTIQGEKVVVALNLKDSQEAAFWAHGGKLLTFTLSSVSIDSQETTKEYQAMLESIKWR